MMSLFSLLWNKSGGLLLGLLGVGVALVGAYFKGRAGGAAKIKRKWEDDKRKTTDQLSEISRDADSARDEPAGGDLRDDDGHKRDG